jgi:hypothetical protein
MNSDEYKLAQRAIDHLIETGGLSGSEKITAKRLYEKLDAFIDGDTISSNWSIDDVFCLMFPEDDGSRGHTEAERAIARDVLDAAERNHDATVGINWEVLECHLDMVMEAQG